MPNSSEFAPYFNNLFNLHLYVFVPTLSCGFIALLVPSCLLVSIYIHFITLLSFHFMNNPSQVLLLCSHKAAYSFLSATFLSTDTVFVFLLQSYETILTWLICWKSLVWGMRLTIPMLFLSKCRHVDHSVPSSWRDAISLGCSNFHSILVILLAALLCIASTDNVNIIIGNLGKVFI